MITPPPGNICRVQSGCCFMMGNSINNSGPLSERILRKCLVETLWPSLERQDALHPNVRGCCQ